MTLARPLPPSSAITNALSNLANATRELDAPERAKTAFLEALAIARTRGDGDAVRNILVNLGAMASESGDYDEAQVFLDEGLLLAREEGDAQSVLPFLVNLSELAVARRQTTRARSLLEEALVLSDRLHSRYAAAGALELAACLAAEEANALLALGLFGAAERLRAEIGVLLTPAEAHFLAPFQEQAQSELGTQETQAPFSYGDAVIAAHEFVAAPRGEAALS